MGPNDFYTIFELQGRDAAAGCTLRPEQRSHGVPPHWMIYIQLRTPMQPLPRRSNWAADSCSAIRRHGRRPHGGRAGSHRREFLRLAGEEEHRNRNRPGSRHALLGRSEHARREARRRLFTPAFSDGRFDAPTRKIRPATCISRTESISLEAFRPQPIASPECRRTGWPTSRWMMWMPPRTRRKSWARSCISRR